MMATDIQKYENKLKEINGVMNRQNTASDAMKNLNLKEIELVKAMDAAKTNKETDRIDSLQKQLDGIRSDRKSLATEMKNTPALSAADAAAAQENARLTVLKERFGNLLEQSFTPQQEYAKAMTDLAVLMQKGIVTETEQRLIAANALKKRNEAMINSLGIGELIKTPETPKTVYDRDLNHLQTALQAGAIVQEQYNRAIKRVQETFGNDVANAAKKFADELATSLGIAEFLKPESKNTLEDVYKNLATYAEKVGMSQELLAAAQDRARTAFEKQSEYYSLYQKAQDALIPAQQKLADAYKRIEAEAAAWGWGKDAVAKMKEMKQAELFGKEKEPDKKSESAQRNNNALERGTVAYFEAQQRGNKPLLDETKRQTKFLASMEQALKTKVENNQYEISLLG